MKGLWEELYVLNRRLLKENKFSQLLLYIEGEFKRADIGVYGCESIGFILIFSPRRRFISRKRAARAKFYLLRDLGSLMTKPRAGKTW